MADLNDSFRREVDEELRRERMTAIWKQYGKYLIAGVGAVLLGLAGFKFWQNSRLVAAQQAGASYTEASQLIKQGKTEEGLKALESVAKSAPGGYTALSHLQIAGAQRQAGKPEEAIKTYEQLAATTSADPILRDYATLQIAALQLGKADFTAIKNRLNPLLVDDNAYRFSARELVGLAAYHAGNMTDARATFDKLMLDPATPPGMSQRTRMMLARISENEIASTKTTGAKPDATSSSPSPSPSTASTDNADTKTEPVAKTEPAATTTTPDAKPASEEKK